MPHQVGSCRPIKDAPAIKEPTPPLQVMAAIFKTLDSVGGGSHPG
jgi:hypothetical protein